MKTKGRVISLLICICMLMQCFATVAFAETEYGYALNEPGGTLQPGGFITYFDVQQNMSDDLKSIIKYNSDFYDFDAEDRETPYVTFTNKETKESFDQLLESSPLKCVYEKDENGNQRETGRYNLEIYVPEEIESGTYNLTVMTFPPEGKKGLSTVGPIHFSIPNVIVESEVNPEEPVNPPEPEYPEDPEDPEEPSIFTYTIENGEVTITCCDTSVAGIVEIPSTIEGYPVTIIGESAFKNCKRIVTLVIPEGVTAINNFAFDSCARLTYMVVPSTLDKIGTSVFTGLPLTDIYYGGTEEEWDGISVGMGNYHLSYIKNMHYGEKPDDLPSEQDVSKYTYEIVDGEVTITDYQTSGGGYIYLPEKIKGYPVTAIGDSAFYRCSQLTGVDIPEGIKVIGNNAFDFCTGLQKVVIEGAETIGDNAFYYCSKLADVTILSSMSKINASAFEFCRSLANITIPENVQTIGSRAFYGCEALTEIKLPVDLCNIDSYAFYNCTGLVNIELPEGTETIGESAFDNCTKLALIKIPESVTNIDKNAFSYCGKLTEVYYGGTETKWNAITIGEGNDKLLSATVYFAEDPEPDVSPYTYTIENEEVTITDCDESLSGDIEIPATIEDYPVKVIGEEAFVLCKNITSIKMSDLVETIEDRAFSQCTALESVTIPKYVDIINDSLFWGCENLTEVIIEGDVTYLGSLVFYGCTSLGEITIPDTVTRIEDQTFEKCKNLKKIIIPDGVTHIGGQVFTDCSSLESVTIPTGITGIGYATFSGCESLTDVYYQGTKSQWDAISMGLYNDALLNANIHYLGEPEEPSIYTYTIENGEVTITGCDTTVSGELTIPDTIEGYPVTGIGISAFAYCTNLTSVIIPDTVTNLAGNVFFECINLASVTLPKGITGISNDTFYLCKSLKDITIPNGVTGISFCAFQRCETMTSITIPNTVTNIDDNAFDGCSSLTDVYYGGTEDEWNAIVIGTYGNDALLNANIHFADDPINPPEPDPEPTLHTVTFIVGNNNYAEIQVEDGEAIGSMLPADPQIFGYTFNDWVTTDGFPVTADTAITGDLTVVARLIKVEEPDEPTGTEIIFNIADTTTLAPVSGAKVIIVNEDETKAQEFTSAEDGTATLAIPNGTYTVQVMASGYDVRTFTVEKTDENYEFSVYLNKNPLIKIETSAKVMTKQEMVDAGIDVEAADNKHVYKCTTVLKFVPVTTGSGSVDITPVEINFDYIYDAQGTIINAKPVRQNGIVIYPVAKDIYLIVHSETTWLKEMFDVQLVITNTSSIEKIKDCEINLDLPEGLSLATMVEDEQALTVEVDVIKPQETKDIHWYVRGDEAGEYTIGGNITGVREGGGIIEDLKASFAMQDPITVLAGDAMKLKIEAERYATAGEPYKMRYTLQNVSSRTLYDVALNVLGGKFCKAFSVEELIHNGELVDFDNLGGTFNNGIELKDEEFAPGEVLTGVFEITFGMGITTDYIEYMVSEMYTFTGEGSTTTIPTEITLVDSVGKHMYDDGVVTVKPSCTASGKMAYTCTICGETMEVVVPALGHALGNWITSKDATCTAEGEKYRDCRNCDYTETAVLGKVSHKYDQEVVKEPTTTEEGVMKCTCSECGDVKSVAISVCITGDTNCDEEIDTKDVISVRRFISGGYGVMVYIAAADINKDGVVDVKDVILVRRYIVGGYGVEIEQ